MKQYHNVCVLHVGLHTISSRVFFLQAGLLKADPDLPAKLMRTPNMSRMFQQENPLMDRMLAQDPRMAPFAPMFPMIRRMMANADWTSMFSQQVDDFSRVFLLSYCAALLYGHYMWNRCACRATCRNLADTPKNISLCIRPIK